MTAHLCHAEGCTTPVPRRMFACAAHWAKVPRWLQRALWRVYREGQEVGRAPVTDLYLTVQTRCRLAIAEREGRDTSALRTELVRRIVARIPEGEGMPDDEVISRFDAVVQERVALRSARGA